MLNDVAEYKTKMSKLMIEFNNDRMPDTDFIHSFMPRVWKKVQGGIPLSPREKEVIDDLFDRN